MICHITTRDAGEAAQPTGEFRSPEFDEIGFMHGSVFPHVYGPINVDSVARVEQLVPSDSGSFKMPRPA